MDPNYPNQGFENQQQPGAFGAPQEGAPGGGIPGGAIQQTGGAGVPDDKERMWAMIAHLSFFVLAFIGPLVLMFAGEGIVGKDSAFVKQAAKQALIWQIASIALGIVTCGFGSLVMMIFAVLGGLAANKGEWYVYPGLASFVDK